MLGAAVRLDDQGRGPANRSGGDQRVTSYAASTGASTVRVGTSGFIQRRSVAVEVEAVAIDILDSELTQSPRLPLQWLDDPRT